MKRLILACIVSIGLGSCEKETYVDYVVDNQSASSVFIDGRSIIHATEIALAINPSEAKTVLHWKKFGKQSDLFEPTSMFGDDLIITNSTGDTLQKDYRLLTNWSSNLQDDRAVISHRYVLVVADADF